MRDGWEAEARVDARREGGARCCTAGSKEAAEPGGARCAKASDVHPPEPRSGALHLDDTENNCAKCEASQDSEKLEKAQL